MVHLREKERVFLLAVLQKADTSACPHQRGKTDIMVDITAEKAALPALSITTYTVKSQKQGRLMSRTSMKSSRYCICKRSAWNYWAETGREGEWSLSLMSLMFVSQKLKTPSFNWITLKHSKYFTKNLMVLIKVFAFFLFFTLSEKEKVVPCL